MEFNLEAQTWKVIAPLVADRAGFGSLYEVVSETGETAVAKVVPRAPGAQRELLMGDSVGAARFRTVIPIIDTGESDDSWILVMPRAERSLAQHLENSGGALPLNEVIQILKDIAGGLAEINGEIVHRDLKPANVLLHEGVWKLADFGIARYHDAATADSTRRSNFTPSYAAPEQWNSRRATSATDVYAFGVIAYELLEGTRPFKGPSVEDLREQHLTATAPELASGTAKLRILIEECLYKAPNVRPQPKALLARIESAEKASERSGASKLAAVSHEQVRERSREQAAIAAHRELQDQREREFAIASQSLERIASQVRAEIEDNAPTAVFDRIVGNAAPLLSVSLGNASLVFKRAELIEHWDQPFTVLACSSIELQFGGGNWTGRSHSLWFCDAHEQGSFAWFELAFMESPFRSGESRVEPFARHPFAAQVAFQNVTGAMQVAWPVTEIDRAEPDEFIQRWLGWLADAAAGKLHRPWNMPEGKSHDTWRRQ